ncbi:MAG: hypothetical protein LZF60_90056 [Nitrospira sp.]|nr:MAG: hypothetical protein LZF60_90056 [Nitrospira sp.]
MYAWFHERDRYIKGLCGSMPVASSAWHLLICLSLCVAVAINPELPLPVPRQGLRSLR